MTPSEKKTYDKAGSLTERMDDAFLELGRILRTAQAQNGVLFDQLIKIPCLRRRTAFYLMEIDRVFRPLHIRKSDLASVGWTKLARIAKHVTPDNVTELLELARAHPTTSFAPS